MRVLSPLRYESGKAERRVESLETVGEFRVRSSVDYAGRVAPLFSEATGVFRAAIDMAAAPQRGANPSFATGESGEAPSHLIVPPIVQL